MLRPNQRYVLKFAPNIVYKGSIDKKRHTLTQKSQFNVPVNNMFQVCT